MRLALKTAIIGTGKSQRAIAAETGIAENRLSEIVRGWVDPNEREMESLRNVLGGQADIFALVEGTGTARQRPTTQPPIRRHKADAGARLRDAIAEAIIDANIEAGSFDGGLRLVAEALRDVAREMEEFVSEREVEAVIRRVADTSSAARIRDH